MASEVNPKHLAGCVGIVAQFPASCIWWVLFGMMLHRTGAGAMEWSLYAGYLVLSVICFGIFSFMRIVED